MLMFVMRKEDKAQISIERGSNGMPEMWELAELVNICGLESAFLFNKDMKLTDLWYPLDPLDVA